MLEGR